MLSAFQWRLIKAIGYPLFFLVCFALFFMWTFPVDRFVPMAESRLSEFTGRDVKVGGASMSLGGSLVLEAVEIGLSRDGAEIPSPVAGEKVADGKKEKTSEGEKEEAKPAIVPKYTIDEITVSVGFLDLLLDTLDLEIDAELLGGELSISYEGPLGDDETAGEGATPAASAALKRAQQRALAAKEGASAKGTGGAESATSAAEDEGEGGGEPLALSIEATGIQLLQIHDLRRKAPIPISGAIDLLLELHSESGSFAEADGRVSVKATSLKIGDSKNPSDIGGMPITVDEMLISELAWDMEVKKGTCSVEKFEVKSTDFAAAVEGTIALADPLSRSRLDLYIRFKLLDGYTQKSSTAKMLVTTLPEVVPAFKRALRTDGFFGFRYRGMFGSAQFTPSKTFRGKADKERERTDRKSRRSGARGRKSQAAAQSGGPQNQGIPETTQDRVDEERFPDLKPPTGSGPFGVDPVPPPLREREAQPEPSPAPEEPSPAEETQEEAPAEQPQAQPEEAAEQAPEEQAPEEGQGQEQEQAPSEEPTE